MTEDPMEPYEDEALVLGYLMLIGVSVGALYWLSGFIL